FTCFFFFSSRRRHTRFSRDWSSDVCSSDLHGAGDARRRGAGRASPGGAGAGRARRLLQAHLARNPDVVGVAVKTNGKGPEEKGFQFPGTFELAAMGAADKDLETALPTCLRDAGIDVVTDRVQSRHSSNERYVSVRILF